MSKYHFIYFRLVLSVLVMISFSVVSTVFAEEEVSTYSIHIQGEKINYDYDYTPIVHNSAVYVPLWGTLGKLGISAEAYNGVIRINHPYRVMLLRADSNMIYYYGREMDIHFARLEFPAITKNDVIYVPLVFLSSYLDISFSIDDNRNVYLYPDKLKDNDTSWGNNEIIKNQMDTLRLDADSEEFWAANTTLWYRGESKWHHDDVDEPKQFVSQYVDAMERFHRYQQLTVIGYSGNKVTLTNGKATVSTKMISMEDINSTFYLSDPLNEYDWSYDIKEAIRSGKVVKGMTKEQAKMSWGTPYKVISNINNINEQWVYLGFDNIGAVYQSLYFHYEKLMDWN